MDPATWVQILDETVCVSLYLHDFGKGINLSVVLHLNSCLVGWGGRINQLFLCRGVRSSTNQRPVYDTQKSDGEVTVTLKLWGMQSTPLLPSLPGLLWPGVVEPDRVLSMGQIELNCVLMQNWTAWNRNVLTFKLRTYAKLNCFKWNCFCMLNWTVWNSTILTLKLYLR